MNERISFFINKLSKVLMQDNLKLYQIKMVHDYIDYMFMNYNISSRIIYIQFFLYSYTVRQWLYFEMCIIAIGDTRTVYNHRRPFLLLLLISHDHLHDCSFSVPSSTLSMSLDILFIFVPFILVTRICTQHG